ncbi:MAG: phosphoribosylglycinamide formyltransferase [Bdellovibrionales bacterium]
MRPRLVVLASGEGTNFQALVEASRTGHLQGDIVGLVANRESCGAARRAQNLGVPWRFLSTRTFRVPEAYDQALVDLVRSWRADWVVLAGYLALIGPKVLAAYPRRLVNSHPALLPKFGGAGMYGAHVHRAVLAAGEVETGITIHYLDEEYDRGEIIAQARVPVLPTDTTESLSARVKELENSFYPKVLNDLILGRKSEFGATSQTNS